MYLLKHIVIALLFSHVIAYKCTAQLRVNDICPNIKLAAEMNGKKQVFKLSDFKGKAVIIDFWDTRCLSCISSFPNIDSLQKRFPETVKIVLVTKQKTEEINRFFAMFKKIRRPGVLMINEDHQLSKLFPSDGYPYTAWLDGNRKLKYLTGGYNITSENLQNFLKGISLDVKTSSKTSYVPLWHLPDSVFSENVKYFSCLTTAMNGIDISLPQNEVLNDGKSVQLSSSGSSLLSLIKQAFGESDKYWLNSQYSIESSLDTSLLFRPEDPTRWDKWNREHTYNYQLIVPFKKKDMMYLMMQEDLQRYFDISVERVKKKVTGYQLTKITDKAIPASVSGKQMDAYNDNKLSADTLIFQNQTFERLQFLLNFWIRYNYPFQTSVSEDVNIDFNIRKHSIEPLNIVELNKDLKPLNLVLLPAEVESEVLVIKPKKGLIF